MSKRKLGMPKFAVGDYVAVRECGIDVCSRCYHGLVISIETTPSDIEHWYHVFDEYETGTALESEMEFDLLGKLASL